MSRSPAVRSRDLLLPTGFRFRLEGTEVRLPKLVEPCTDGAEAGGINPIDSLRALGAILHEARFTQHFQVLGDCGATDGQAPRQYGYGLRPKAETLEDRPPGRVSKRGDGAVFVSHDLP